MYERLNAQKENKPTVHGFSHVSAYSASHAGGFHQPPWKPLAEFTTAFNFALVPAME